MFSTCCLLIFACLVRLAISQIDWAAISVFEFGCTGELLYQRWIPLDVCQTYLVDTPELPDWFSSQPSVQSRILTMNAGQFIIEEYDDSDCVLFNQATIGWTESCELGSPFIANMSHSVYVEHIFRHNPALGFPDTPFHSMDRFGGAVSEFVHNSCSDTSPKEITTIKIYNAYAGGEGTSVFSEAIPELGCFVEPAAQFPSMARQRTMKGCAMDFPPPPVFWRPHYDYKTTVYFQDRFFSTDSVMNTSDTWCERLWHVGAMDAQWSDVIISEVVREPVLDYCTDLTGFPDGPWSDHAYCFNDFSEASVPNVVKPQKELEETMTKFMMQRTYWNKGCSTPTEPGLTHAWIDSMSVKLGNCTIMSTADERDFYDILLFANETILFYYFFNDQIGCREDDIRDMYWESFVGFFDPSEIYECEDQLGDEFQEIFFTDYADEIGQFSLAWIVRKGDSLCSPDQIADARIGKLDSIRFFPSETCLRPGDFGWPGSGDTVNLGPTRSFGGTCKNGVLVIRNYTYDDNCLGAYYRQEEPLCVFDGEYSYLYVCLEPWKCYDVTKLSDSVCSGHGVCIHEDDCECDDGWSGDLCEHNENVIPAFAWYWYPIMGGGGLFVVGIVCLLGSVVVCLCVCNRKQSANIKRFTNIPDIELIMKESELEEDLGIKTHLTEKLYKIDYKDLELKAIIGEGGGNAVVYAGFWEGTKVAIKVFNLRSILVAGGAGESVGLSDFERELQIMKTLSHPHVITFFGAALKAPRVAIVMELCKGDLKDHLVEHTHIGPKERVMLLHQIVQGMRYLHKMTLVHRDLKPQNVLMSTEGLCRLCDFGLSRQKNQMSMTKAIGTNVYIAPEVLLGEQYSYPVDVFSFGIMSWIIITGDFEPYGEDTEFVEHRVSHSPHFRPNAALVRQRWLQKILRRCWDAKPDRRPTFAQLATMLDPEEFETNQATEKLFIYLMMDGSEEKDAEDYAIRLGSYEDLRRIAQKFAAAATENEGVQAVHIRDVKGVPIASNEDVMRLESDDLVVVSVESKFF